MTNQQLGGFTVSEGSRLPKTSGIMAEPGLVHSLDSALLHTALSVQEFLAAKDISVVPYIFSCLIWPVRFFLVSENEIASGPIA
jgi:hypothetical protein